MKGDDCMDILKLNLGSKLLRGIVSKLIVKYIRKHFNCDAELKLNDLKLSYVDGDVIVKTDLQLKLNSNDVKKILTQIEEEL